MKNVKNQKHHHHHQISSFNCLRPPSFLEVIATNNDRRSADDAFNLGRFVSTASGNRKTTIDDWPSSPRIGCMGQIKRSSSYNSRIGGSKKLFQIKKMFTSSPSSSSSSEKITTRMMTTSTRVEDDVCRRGISIADTMDTPLPVILKRRSVKDAANLRGTSLWNRRHGGVMLQSLEIGQVKLRQIQHLRRSFSCAAAERFEAQI